MNQETELDFYRELSPWWREDVTQALGWLAAAGLGHKVICFADTLEMRGNLGDIDICREALQFICESADAADLADYITGYLRNVGLDVPQYEAAQILSNSSKRNKAWRSLVEMTEATVAEE